MDTESIAVSLLKETLSCFSILLMPTPKNSYFILSVFFETFCNLFWSPLDPILIRKFSKKEVSVADDLLLKGSWKIILQRKF